MFCLVIHQKEKAAFILLGIAASFFWCMSMNCSFWCMCVRGKSTVLRAHNELPHGAQKAGDSARTEVYAIEEWERVQAEAALAKEQEEAILVSFTPYTRPFAGLLSPLMLRA